MILSHATGVQIP
ncbi:MAG: hypothetical protein FJ306_02300 [Planctomycetes bacterium]|nr:hypothetical protein [Planctomycetota bacterium]MBM3972666.1 hypothetical protein [Planctomycetota bacterium]